MVRIAFFTLNAYDMLTGDTGSGAVGGAQLQQILIGKELASRGHKIYFVEHDATHKREQNVDGINVVLKPKPKGNEVVRAASVLFNTAKTLRRIDPDVCYRRALDFEIISLALLCNVTHSGFVYGVAHDNNLDDIPGTFDGGVKSTRLYGRMNRRAMSVADTVVVQNEYQRKRAQERLGTSVCKITSCYEPGSPDPIAELKNSDSLVVLWVSRFTDFKQPELVLKLARQLPNVQFVMIGNRSDPDLFDTIESQATDLDNIRFEGFVPFEEIDRYFTSADVFLNTSREEGFPNTFLQSWAYNKPVVSLTVNPDSVLTDYDTGWVCSDSVEQMVEHLDELSDNRELITEMGNRAHQYFVENHSIDAIVDRYERMFTKTASE